MKKKYLSLYFIDSAVTFIILILFLALSFLKNDTSVYNFVTYLGKYFLTSAIMVINTALFIVVINLLKKYNLEANSLVFPICYLVGCYWVL